MSDTTAPARQPRQHVTFRMAPAGLSRLDEIAAEEGRSRGDVIRRMIAEGIRSYDRKTAKP